MDPVCTVCGATTDLVGRPEAGWVCAISGPCLQRSARAIMGELRAEDPTFGMPSDMLAGFFQRAVEAITEKDIPSSTDIVDSGSSDSYK